MEREYSATDRLLMRLQRRLAGEEKRPAGLPFGREPEGRPASDVPSDDAARRHAAGLMRVNHAGEVAAQALYQGQALTARDPKIRAHMLEAAREEQQHLRWCEERLAELGAGPSVLKPLWYAGSFAIGAAAGLAGDQWSLGFVAETERQVSEHLDDHLERLPEEDAKSRAIVKKMREDETRHGRNAEAAGGRPLPEPVRTLMRRVAQIMKFGAYRL
jgi:ubiquinone biosynthesis monooxygenase Coq7